jgi:NAD(P)-dependent dehydrogenase (short-subunit alcohol dehydrogenase family)
VAAARSVEKLEDLARRAAASGVLVVEADVADRDSVEAMIGRTVEKFGRLDVLVNNAGLVQSTRTESVDGLETTFATNHLAPFLLTNLLLDLLKKSAPSRVVTVSSEAERWGNIDFDDLQSRRKYRGFPVYGMTKLANIMFTYELAGRLEGTGVTATCMHPGGVATRFGRNNGGPLALFFRAAKPFMRTPEQGADTLVWLASSPDVEGVTGRYFSDRKPIEPKKIANDPEVRRRLWEESERLTGLKVTA